MMSGVNRFQMYNQHGLFPINYWAMTPQVQLYFPKGKERDGTGQAYLMQAPQHPGQYGFAIPVVQVYREPRLNGDVFLVNPNGRTNAKMTTLKPMDPPEEMMGS